LTGGGSFTKQICISVAFLAIVSFNASAAEDVPQSQPVVPVATVKTLRPAFAWVAHESGVSYDLIICAGVYDQHGLWTPGKTVYYCEGIPTPSHVIDHPLQPDTVYVWSVRTRSGNRTSKWAAYGDGDPTLTRKNKVRYNAMCAFKTPSK